MGLGGICVLIWTERAVKGGLPAKRAVARVSGNFEGSTGSIESGIFPRLQRQTKSAHEPVGAVADGGHCVLRNHMGDSFSSSSYAAAPRADAAPRLALSGVSKQYPAVRANDDVTLVVAPGEIHAVLGENGAGKSTLMKIIYGSVRPDAGAIRLERLPVA